VFAPNAPGAPHDLAFGSLPGYLDVERASVGRDQEFDPLAPSDR
jgi:hypothetical protein